MAKKPSDKPVTETVFVKEIKAVGEKIYTLDKEMGFLNREIGLLDSKFDKEVKAIQGKIDSIDSSVKRLAHEILNTKEDFQGMKRTIATKTDINTILNRIDSFATRIETFDKKTVVHDHRLNEIEPKVADHEKRLIILESK